VRLRDRANHGAFVRCAGQVEEDLWRAIPPALQGRHGSGLRQSTCGKADAVTCCTADRPCRVKKSAACTRLGGTPGTTAFCADACAAGSPSGAFLD
jgi:hypothetical protein